jgi:hypothetical protein
MPFISIPPENLAHLPLFGYNLLTDEGDFAWYDSPRGKMRVEKSNLRVWVEDDTTAIQLGAIAIMQVNGDDC